MKSITTNEIIYRFSTDEVLEALCAKYDLVLNDKTTIHLYPKKSFMIGELEVGASIITVTHKEEV